MMDEGNSQAPEYNIGAAPAKVSDLLKASSLTSLLVKDSKEIKEADELISWHHGRITREAAVSILKEAMGNQMLNGLFLVRESTVTSKDHVLTLTNNGEYFHFHIVEKFSGCFFIDFGPVIQGIEKVIERHVNDACGLPTKLISFCKGLPPPHKIRRFGNTNLLHRSVREGNIGILKKILQHKECPDINDKDDTGKTALHIACESGNVDIVKVLLHAEADLSLRDGDNYTCLQIVCIKNNPQIIPLLLKTGRCDSQDRFPSNGWYPLHEAITKGHKKCISELLKFHVPVMPRTLDGETPLDIGHKYGRTDCNKLLEAYVAPTPKTKSQDWLHPELDRQGAAQLLEMCSFREGLFLIRKSKHHEGWYVLTLCHKQSIFHFEIRTCHHRSKFYYYIDDGPFMESLESLVHHYNIRLDGLPCRLKMSLTPIREVKSVPLLPEYKIYAVENESVYHQLDVSKPVLPPRLDSVAPVVVDYAVPIKSPVKEKDMHFKVDTAHPLFPPPPPPTNAPPSRHAVKKSKDSESEVDFNFIPYEDIKKGNILGEGEFGTVNKGQLQVKDKKKTKKVDVALKTFTSERVNSRNDFLREALVMQTLDHKCIVKLIGICEEPLMLVEELVSKGSLLDYLIDYTEKVNIKSDLYLWAAQIASGMTYLESKHMVHRDLAARNILLESKKQAKISDFGLSRAVGTESDYYKASAGGKWPIKWYAPECVNYGQFSHASDVWSYGVTLWEMFSFGDSPYGEMKGIEVVKYIENGKRLEIPNRCPEEVYKVMLQCWEVKPIERLTFEELHAFFDKN